MGLTLVGLWKLVCTVLGWLWNILRALFLAGALFIVGNMRGAGRVRVAWTKETEQRNELARETARARTEVVAQTEIVYRDRIKKITSRKRKLKSKCRSTLSKLITVASLSILASYVSTMPLGQASLPDLPSSLTVNPPEFRLLKSLQSKPVMPQVALPGER
ncbi:hypothetical protein [Collimonas arenae]|uniref:hypothetical protein n=1 Tax=Collimonas arenae TaxID=279058 RepID=UPI0005702382|nr:hypothetical protein [Collimonas arenae]